MVVGYLINDANMAKYKTRFLSEELPYNYTHHNKSICIGKCIIRFVVGAVSAIVVFKFREVFIRESSKAHQRYNYIDPLGRS